MAQKRRRVHWSARLMRRVLATPTVLAALAFLPVVFPEGTSFHETAFTIRTYGALGVLLSEFFSWWCKEVIQWFEGANRDWGGDPWFVPAVLAPVPLVSVVAYLAARIFEHGGEWDVIFTQFSWETLLVAVLVCGLAAPISGFTVMATTRLEKGEHPLIRGAKAPPRWVALLIVGGMLIFPMLCILLYRAFHGGT